MPRAARARKVTSEQQIFVVQGGAAAELAPNEALAGSPLFELTGDLATVAKISVIRDEPLEEGHVGYVRPEATEADISRRFGGGLFRLQAKTETGQHIKGGFKTVRIAGEPKFADAVSMAKYARLRRQEMGQSEPEQQSKGQPSILEVLELQERKAEMARQQAREDFSRREEERDAAHRREMERLKLEAEARDRERKAEDDRRERERQLLEDRRERDRVLEDERRRKDQEEGRARDREYFAAMLKMSKEDTKANGLGGVESAFKLLMTAREMFGEGGGGGGDAVTELMRNIPAILDKSSGIAEQMTAKPTADQGDGTDPDAMTLGGIHGRKLAAAMKNIASQGLDPQKVLLVQLDQLARARIKPAPQAAPNVSAPDEKQSDQAQASPAAKRRAPKRARASR